MSLLEWLQSPIVYTQKSTFVDRRVVDQSLRSEINSLLEAKRGGGELANLHVQVLYAPFEGFLVGVEEDVESVSFYCAAAVEDLDGPAVVIAGHDHFCAKCVALVGGYECVVRLYLVAGCGYAVGVLAAAFRAGAVCGYAHRHDLRIAGFCMGCTGDETRHTDNRHQAYPTDKSTSRTSD